MIFRLRAALHGEHWYVAVFSKPSPEHLTFAKNGELRLRPAEWAAFRRLLIRGLGGDERPDGAIDIEVSEDE